MELCKAREFFLASPGESHSSQAAQTKTAPGRAPFLHSDEERSGLLGLATAEGSRTDQTCAEQRQGDGFRNRDHQ